MSKTLWMVWKDPVERGLVLMKTRAHVTMKARENSYAQFHTVNGLYMNDNLIERNETISLASFVSRQSTKRCFDDLVESSTYPASRAKSVQNETA